MRAPRVLPRGGGGWFAPLEWDNNSGGNNNNGNHLQHGKVVTRKSHGVCVGVYHAMFTGPADLFTECVIQRVRERERGVGDLGDV